MRGGEAGRPAVENSFGGGRAPPQKVGRSVGRSVGRPVGRSVGRSVGQSVSQSVSQSDSTGRIEPGLFICMILDPSNKTYSLWSSVQ